MKRIFYIIFGGLTLTTGCSKFGHDADSRIGLSVGICSLDIDTKVAGANPYDETMISGTNSFETAVWFSLKNDIFENNPDNTSFLPCHTTMNFTSTGITYASYKNGNLEKDLTYPIPEDGKAASVYCVGFYPSSGWLTSDGETVSHEITGSEDLMYAPKITGDWVNRFSEQTYNHQLTWLKINACATTMEAGKQWGGIAKVEVVSDQYINIDLTKATGNISFNTPVYITTFENTDTGVENVDDEEEENQGDEYVDQQLTLNSIEVGSVFCSPEKQYSIRITMKSGVVKNLDIPLKNLNGAPLTSESEAAGKLFVINLYFQPFAIVEGTSMLYYWNNKNEDLLPM